ncbi:hypothetical protein BGX28_003836 [Mortierella sp. GBA30]|nr:hypothetical protein BGX28_003836 [Mortierella sp. GBA30]
MRFSIVALATTLVGAVMAQQAYTTAPIGSTVWTVGKPATISWKLNATAKGVALPITLFKGDPTHQTQVQELYAGAADAVTYKLPAVPQVEADWYSIRIGDSYSAQFVIETADGRRPSGAPPSASSVAPTVAAPSSTIAPTAAPSTSAVGTSTTGAAKPTQASAGSYLSAGPLAVTAAAVVAAALSL